VANDLSCGSASISKSAKAIFQLINSQGELEKWLTKNYKFIEKSDEWNRYAPKEVTSINEMLIMKSSRKMNILIKKAAGTTRIELGYKKLLGQRVIKTIKYTSYEGIQSIKSQSTIIYRKYKKGILPVRLKRKGLQSLGHKELAQGSASGREFNDIILISRN
jgi:ribosomal protein S8